MKKNSFLRELIGSFRLSITIPAAILVCLGYKLSGLPTNWLVFLDILIIASTTMLTNDYIDRGNDAHQKQKYFALVHEFVLLPIIVALWILATVISFSSFAHFGWGNILLWYCILVGIVYSYTRNILLLPTLLVAFTGAAPILFGHIETHRLAPLIAFVSVVFITFGRELLKDGIDSETDMNYKKTVFTAGWIRKENITLATALFVAFGIVINMPLSLTLHPIQHMFYTAGVIWTFIFLVLPFMSKRYVSHEKLKDMIDVGTFMMLASLLL